MEDYFPSFKQNTSERFSISILSPQIALIDINTFDLFDTDIDSIGSFIRKLSDSSFHSLIIDVRDNYGGSSDVIADIFSFIAKKPFKQTLYQKVNKKGKYELFKNCLNYSSQINNVFPEYEYVNEEEGFYLKENHFPAIEPNDSIHFDKNIYVLTNELSLSAATVFPALVHKQKRGVIIGRESGSSYYHLNALKFAHVYLKNTRLELYMPLVKIVFDEQDKSDIPWGRGVIPEYVIKINYKEFLSNEDPILNTTINIIDNATILEKESAKSEFSMTYLFIGIFIILLLGIFLFRIPKKLRN